MYFIHASEILPQKASAHTIFLSLPHETEMIGVDAAHEMLRVGFAPCRAALLGLSVESVQTAHRFSDGAVGDVDALSLDDRAEEFNAFLVVLQVILFGFTLTSAVCHRCSLISGIASSSFSLSQSTVAVSST